MPAGLLAVVALVVFPALGLGQSAGSPSSSSQPAAQAAQAGSQTMPASNPQTRPTDDLLAGLFKTPSASASANDQLATRPDDDVAIGLRYIASIVMFLAIGGIAILAARRFRPRIAGPGTGRDLAVLESVRLGRDGFVYLLRAGAGRYLLAKSKDGVATLVEVTGAFPSDGTATASPGGAKDDSAPAVQP